MTDGIKMNIKEKNIITRYYFTNKFLLALTLTLASASIQPLHAQTEDQIISMYIKERFKKPEIANAYATEIDFDTHSRCMFISQMSTIDTISIPNRETRMISKTIWGMMNEGMKIAKSRLITNGYSNEDIKQNVYKHMDIANLYLKNGNKEGLNSMTFHCKEIALKIFNNTLKK
jgi:hypothetical protein